MPAIMQFCDGPNGIQYEQKHNLRSGWSYKQQTVQKLELIHNLQLHFRVENKFFPLQIQQS